ALCVRGAGTCRAAEGEDGAARRVPRRSAVAMDRGAREDRTRRAAVHRRRRRRGEGLDQSVRRHDRTSAEGRAMTAAPIDFSIVFPALIAGLLVTAIHVPLGTQVL